MISISPQAGHPTCVDIAAECPDTRARLPSEEGILARTSILPVDQIFYSFRIEIGRVMGYIFPLVLKRIISGSNIQQAITHLCIFCALPGIILKFVIRR